MTIIDRDGYRAVSIDAIARELDVTRPVVYHVFDGLDELLTALLDRQEQRALQTLLATVGDRPDIDHPRRYLRRVVTDLIAMVTADPATWKPILLASSDTPDTVRRRVERDRAVVHQQFMTLITSAAGRTGTDADVLAHCLIALAEYFGRLALENPGAVDASAVAEAVSTLLTSTARVVFAG